MIERATAEGHEVEKPGDKEIRRRINYARNELKHNDGGKNRPVSADIVYEAEDMILRALRNYYKLYGKHPPQKEVLDWWDNMTL